MFYFFSTLIVSLFLIFQNIPKEKYNSVRKNDFEINKTTIQNKNWVDSVYSKMSLREKLGQLFMVKAYSNQKNEENKEISKLIKKYHIGGICFFQGSPFRQGFLTNQFQKISKIPLMTAIDGEWGLGMRLDSTFSYPRAMTLGAIQDTHLIEEMGEQIAEQCQTLGIHINFAPVADINNNLNNPVIADRSFGEIVKIVNQNSLAYMKGMQNKGLITTAKHFPGHGDTDVDSHEALPIIKKNENDLENLELQPFQYLINQNLSGVMVAHLKVTAWDTLPTSISKKVISNILKEKLNFQGLVFTDALEMKGILGYLPTGELELKALEAGVDVLLISHDVPKAISYLEKAYQKGILKEDLLAKKVKKILNVKYLAGLHSKKLVDLKKITERLQKPSYQNLITKLYQKSFTLLKNTNEILPLKTPLENIATLAINTEQKTIWQKEMDLLGNVKHFQIHKKANETDFEALIDSLKRFPKVIIGINGMNRRRKENYNFSEIHKNFIKKLGQKTQVGLVVFGSPYSLQNIQNTQFLICGYEDNIFTQRNIVQSLIGKNKIEGKLPVSIGEFKVGEGLEMMPQTTQTLASSFEGATSVDKDSLQKIDILMKKALKDKLFAGSQVLVIHKNQIIFDKNYGKTAYKKTFNPQNITENHLFDIASLTKVLATLPAIMYLYEQKRFNLEDKVSDYLEDLKNTNKEDITIQELLTHQSGLEPFQAHYKRTLSKNTPSPIFYNKQKNEVFSLKVAENLYARADLKDSLWKWTKQCKRNPKEPNGKYKYEYSDINFYILKKLADKLLNQPAEIFIKKYLYEPLGLKKTTFNPLENTEQKWIVPTEKDTYFRMQTIWGYVHDPGAAMHGGIAGHAGLFSTAKEVGILMQMFLQKGKYGEKQFFKPETIETFIKPPFEENRRGLGWDRIDKMPLSYVPDKASENSFGHSGFTGCMAWADIKYDLVIVILSNRVHPEVKKEDPFVKQHFRRKIMNCVYEGIKN